MGLLDLVFPGKTKMEVAANIINAFYNLNNLPPEINKKAAVPDIPLRPVFRGYEESAFVNFLEQSHDGTGGWPRYGRPPAAG